MDTLTFIAQVISALAWPITAIIIFLIMRRPLLNLLNVVQRLRFQGLELEFTRQVSELAVEMRRELPRAGGLLNGPEEKRTDWLALAQTSPRAVVLEAWVQLEKEAAEAARRHGLNLRSADLKLPLVLGQALEEAGLLEGETPGIYHQLRNLRNAAAHASDFALTPDAAIEYADLAARLAEYLRGV